MNVKVKICGLQNAQDVAAANRACPDYVGFVFAAQSRRFVTAEQAKKLRANLADGITPVGVFVHAPVEQIAQLWREGVIDVVQLHGQEDEAYLTALRVSGIGPIWQAFPTRSQGDVERAMCSSADLILLDNGAGGTGECFDWSLVEQIPRPFLLAGGLTVENVGEAVEKIKPYGVDTSSGVEQAGRKSPEKMMRFVQTVRALEQKKERLRCYNQEVGLEATEVSIFQKR